MVGVRVGAGLGAAPGALTDGAAWGAACAAPATGEIVGRGVPDRSAPVEGAGRAAAGALLGAIDGAAAAATDGPLGATDAPGDSDAAPLSSFFVFENMGQETSEIWNTADRTGSDPRKNMRPFTCK